MSQRTETNSHLSAAIVLQAVEDLTTPGMTARARPHRKRQVERDRLDAELFLYSMERASELRAHCDLAGIPVAAVVARVRQGRPVELRADYDRERYKFYLSLRWDRKL